MLGCGFTMDASDGLFLSNASEAPGVMARIIYRMGCSASTMQQIDSCACEFPTSHPQRAVAYVAHSDSAGAGSDTVAVMCAFDRVATAPGVASHAPAAVSPLLTPPRYTYLMANDRGSALPFCDIVKLDACGTGRQVWRSDGVVGEPCFVPRPGQLIEYDGWIIVQVQRLVQGNQCGEHGAGSTADCVQATTEFVVLDARDMSKGRVAVVAPGILIPTGFHGKPVMFSLLLLPSLQTLLSREFPQKKFLGHSPVPQALSPLCCAGAATCRSARPRRMQHPSQNFDNVVCSRMVWQRKTVSTALPEIAITFNDA